jgi:hypothetical protein
MAATKHTHEEIINLLRNIPAERLPELYNLLQGFLQGQKRDYARKPLSGEVDLVIRDRVYKQQIENISASGVFVRMKGQFEPGTQVRFVLDLPGADTPMKLTGHIARVADDGIAIQFDNTTPYFQEFLNSTIWSKRQIDRI